MTDLSDDLRLVRKRIEEHGWVRGELIDFDYDEDDPEKVVAAGCCLTGAVGMVTETRFDSWVSGTRSSTAETFPWSDRGKQVLHTLATLCPPDLTDEVLDCDSDIENIIEINDSRKDVSEILGWIDFAISQIKSATTPAIQSPKVVQAQTEVKSAPKKKAVLA